MIRGGYIKLHRSFLDWEWYTEPKCARVFLHLLLTANHAGARWRGVEIRRGQRVVGLETLAGEVGLSVKNVRTALDHLKKSGAVATERVLNCSLITIKNYDLYQGSGAPRGSGAARGGQVLNKEKEEERKEGYYDVTRI